MRTPALLLAVPFLIGIAVLKGLTVEIDTFHGSDAAVYQVPTIMHFREGLHFSDYPSAQTPLFHLVMAGWGKLVGFDLWKLRLLNVAISYAAALALLRLLRRSTSLDVLPAFALTLAFTLSPYFFGASFTLLTDNLAILFALLALERLYTYRQEGSFAVFATACLWTGAALLTRQSFLWVALGGGRLPRSHRPAVPGPAVRRPRAAGARARPRGRARDRMERARAAERGPGLVRALHRQARGRPRLADAAHGRVHGRGIRALRRGRARPRRCSAARLASTGAWSAPGRRSAWRWC